MSKRNKQFYEFGPFVLDPTRRLLSRQDQVIPLTPKVLHTLVVLVENSGRVVSKDELMKAVWPDTFVEDGNLTQNISMLRKVLGENPGEHAYIETVPKQGYRFIADVAEQTQTGATPRLTRERGLRWVGVLLGVVLIAAGIGLYISERMPAASSLRVTMSPKVTPLTSYPGLELHPTLAPDGNQVAFAWDGERQDNLDIYIKVVGSDRSMRLTDNPAYDFRPAWSPDGRWIAFLRGTSDRKASIVRIPPTGGPERRVAEVDAGYRAGYDRAPRLEWTPDSKWLLTADRVSTAEGSSLFLISVESGEKKRLTFPPSGSHGDVTGAISPDGRTLVFSRLQSGIVGEFCTLEMSADFAAAGEPSCFAINEGRLATARSIRWTPNPREIMFSPLFTGTGQASLWTMPLPQRHDAVGVPQRFPIPSNSARDPAISRDGGRLIYSDVLVDADIWRLDLQNAGARPIKLITSTRSDWGAQYSPDGEKILFLSSRSGRPAIWVAAKDGSKETQLTFLEAPLTGSPRWSPDARRIVFDSDLEGQHELYLINADGSGLRRLTNHPNADATGNWSHDGQWIYFGSRRSGERQIWKMHADGAEPTQITKHGGEGLTSESPDGKFVYFIKDTGSSTGSASLWRTPVSGGEEVKILDSLYRLQWTVTASGIYFAAPADSGSSYATSIRFLSFQTGKVTTVASREWGGQAGLSVSPDGRFLLYSFAQLIGSDLMLVENFDDAAATQYQRTGRKIQFRTALADLSTQSHAFFRSIAEVDANHNPR